MPVPGLVLRDERHGVGVVGEPFGDLDAGLALDLEHPTTVGQLDGLGDDPAGPERGALVAATDLGAAGDQHDAETVVTRQAVPHERPVAGFEDVQRHRRVGEQHRPQGEHGQTGPGHPPPWHGGAPARIRPGTHALRRVCAAMAARTREKDRPRDRSLTRVVIVFLSVSSLLGSSLRRSGCGGRLVGRPAHAPARARPQSYAGLHTVGTARSVTETDVGDALSTRWTDLLGRACRLHRTLLSTRGNGGCSNCHSFSSSICLGPQCVNPTRTGHSRTPWWDGRRHVNFISL